MLAALLLSSAIALSFDDLPGASVQWNEKVLATLRKHHATAIGFVNCGINSQNLGVLDRWLAEGHQLGNHTAHHLDLNSVSVEKFEADVIAGECRQFKWFRYPALHTGPTRAVRDEVASFLQKRGYRNAVVTLDSNEFLYDRAYATVYPEHAELIAKAKIKFIESIVDFFEKRTKEVVGHPIPQVLLLHMSAMNADHLDELLTMLERRGYHFVTIDKAMSDPAYSLPDGYAGKKGLSQIHRWGVAKGMPVVLEPDARVP